MGQSFFGGSSGFAGGGFAAAGCALMTDRSSWPSSRNENDEQRLTARATSGLLWVLLELVAVGGTWRSCSVEDLRGLMPATNVCRMRSQKLAFSERGTRLWDLVGGIEEISGSGSLLVTTTKGFSDWGLVGLGEGVTSKPILSRCSLGLATTTGQSGSEGGGSGRRERFSFIRWPGLLHGDSKLSCLSQIDE